MSTRVEAEVAAVTVHAIAIGLIGLVSVFDVGLSTLSLVVFERRRRWKIARSFRLHDMLLLGKERGSAAFVRSWMSMTRQTHTSRSNLSVAPASHIASATLTVRTNGVGFTDITRDAGAFLREVQAREGQLTLFIRHTSASLTIQENADPSVLKDLLTALDRLAPQDGGWVHNDEGPDDMPGHIRTMLTATSLQVPVLQGAMALGTWQGIYLIEHRTRPHQREVVLQFLGAVNE